MLVAACALERAPELSENTRALNYVLPDRSGGVMLDEDRFGNRVMPGPMTDAQTGGMRCGDTFCPFVVAPMEQCCTDEGDVARGTARIEGKCGVSFANAGTTTFGNGCWQRDQAGTVDPSCPDLLSGNGSIAEVGCCTDQGECGTVNNASGVGCHYVQGAERKACGAEIDTSVECNPLGVFGVRISVDVAWGGRSGGLVGLTDDGRDNIYIDLKVIVDSVDGDLNVRGAAQPCNVDLPRFYSTTLCEAYKPIFPTSIWESEALPRIPITGRYLCKNPGCSFTIDAITSLIGIALDNPEAPWPTADDTGRFACAAGVGIDCFPDHDRDGLPGITVGVQSSGQVPRSETPSGTPCGGTYDHWGAPLSASAGALIKAVRRTDRIQLGTRTKLGGTSVLAEDCMTSVGGGIADFVQSRAYGCFVQEGTTNDPLFNPRGAGPNEPCDGNEAAFMDENLPIYEVLAAGEVPPAPIDVEDLSASVGPRISVVRLGDAGQYVSCEQVRSAPYRE